MHQLFMLQDREHEIGLTRPDDRYRLHLDDSVLTVDMRDTGPGLCRLTVDGTGGDVRVAVDGDTIWVQLDGAVHELRYVDPVKRFAGQGGGAAEDIARAPMPGTAILLLVGPGQAVQRGDTLVVIESMKLETAIRAWRDGIIAAVHVVQGGTFDRGAALVTLASES